MLKGQGARFYLWVVKPATLLFISFSSNIPKVARFRGSFHRSFSTKGILFLQRRVQTFRYGGEGGGRRPGHPDPEISGGSGLKFFFRLFGPRFGLKIRVEPGPRTPPLDSPQFKASRTFFFEV